LRKLSDELAKKNLHGEILLTDGASMCLVHEARDMTKDIDALYEPKTIINNIAIEIAKRNNIQEDWFNDSVKGFIRADAPVEDFILFNNLRVQSVTAEYLLAMKLMSARQGETDYGDIRFLLNKLSINTVDQVFIIMEKYYEAHDILPKTMYVIESMLP